MSYASGTMTGNATVGQTFATIIKDALIAHANWTLEDTVVGATQTYYVLKNAAAGNSAGVDWRLFVGYTTATPTATFLRIAEGWNTGTDLASKPGFFNTSTGLGSDNSLGGTFTVEDATTWGRFPMTPAASGTPRYDICTSSERTVIWVASTTTNFLAYAGLYEIGPGLTSGTAPMPLCLTGIFSSVTPAVGSSSGPGGGALTRHPERTAGSVQNGRCMFARMLQGGDSADDSSQAAGTRQLFPHIFPAGGIDLGADAFDSRQEVAKIPLVTQSPSVGGLLGYPKKLVVARQSTTITRNFGDSMTIGSETYQYVGSGLSGDPDAASSQALALFASTADS